ncbi:hypothetical protein B5M09_006193, partial [Aphanomyces astaci]
MQTPRLVSSVLNMSAKTLTLTFSHPIASAAVTLLSILNPQTNTKITLTRANDFVRLQQAPTVATTAATAALSFEPGFANYDNLQCKSTRIQGCWQPLMLPQSPILVTTFVADVVGPSLSQFTYDQQYIQLRFSKVMDRSTFQFMHLCDSLVATNCIGLSAPSRLIPRGSYKHSQLQLSDVAAGEATTTTLPFPVDETLWIVWVSPSTVAQLNAAGIGLTRGTSFVSLPPGLRDIQGNAFQGPTVQQAATAGCRPCHFGLYASTHCSPTQNRVCSACTKCTNDQYEFSPCTTEADRVCLTCDSCALTWQQEQVCKKSVAFERRKRSPYGCVLPVPVPPGRKTWDKELKAWVPYVDKSATTNNAASSTPPFRKGIPTKSSPRQPWLKPSAVIDPPRFKLFGKGGEIQVDSNAAAGRGHPPPKQQQQQQKKSFKFEKSLFSKDYFPDVSWNSSAASTTADHKSHRQRYQQRNNATDRHPKNKFRDRKRSNVTSSSLPQREMKVEIPDTITVEDLADRMCIKSHLLLRTLRTLGERDLNETSELSATVAELAVEDLGMIPILVQGFVDIKPTDVPADCAAFPARPPIVTVMGHVDHGKTTLLDALRNTTTTEHGGITQKIGSFTVPLDDKSIVFFDTPGHAAFSTMRAQGCSLTDILVVVIAADDGIQPQTKEVLRLAIDQSVPLIVAVTKCDRFPGQEDEIIARITKEVQMEGIHDQDMQLVCVSGKTGQGLDDLKQAILLQADIMELAADTSKPGEGVVVEGSVVRGYGWPYDLPKTGQTILPVETEAAAKEIVAERARILEQVAIKEAEAAAARLREGEAAHVPIGRRGKGRQLELQRQERAKEEERMDALTPEDDGYVAKVVPVVLKANALGIITAIDHMIAELNAVSRECTLKCIYAGV